MKWNSELCMLVLHNDATTVYVLLIWIGKIRLWLRKRVVHLDSLPRVRRWIDCSFLRGETAVQESLKVIWTSPSNLEKAQWAAVKAVGPVRPPPDPENAAHGAHLIRLKKKRKWWKETSPLLGKRRSGQHEQCHLVIPLSKSTLVGYVVGIYIICSKRR